MKQALQISICLLLLLAIVCLGQARETFDIATFQAPKGWNTKAGQDSIVLSTENKADFCVVILYRSLPGSADAKENFDSAWGTIVKEAVTVSSAPEMAPAESRGEWQILGGYAPFEKDGQKGVALLYTATGHGRMMNALVLTNTGAYEAALASFLGSITFKKPETAAPVPATSAPVANSIVGTWGQNLGAHMTYGDPVAAGMAGYSKDQYTFNANGTYTFVSKTFRMAYDKIILVIENGTYQINGNALSIRPQKSVIQAWSKLNGGDGWGRLLSTQPRKLEAVTYKFTKHYFSGIDEWNLVLQADQPTERDGPFSTFKLFANAWYYKPISPNNPVVQLPR